MDLKNGQFAYMDWRSLGKGVIPLVDSKRIASLEMNQEQDLEWKVTSDSSLPPVMNLSRAWPLPYFL